MEMEINASQFNQILKEFKDGRTDYLESIIGIKVDGFINVSASIKNKYKIVW